MRVALLFFLATCVLATLGQRTVVDLWWESAPGRINLGPVTFGATGAFAVELQCFFTQAPASSLRSSILSLSSQQRSITTNDFEIFFVGNALRLRLGDSIVSSSLPVDNVDKWAYIAVNVVQDGAVARPQLFVNGVDQTGTLTPSTFSTALVADTRDNNFIGYNNYKSSVSNFHGRVDSVYLWAKALTLSAVQTRAALVGQDPAYDGNGLIVRFLFKETVGKKTVGERGDAGQESYPATLDYPRAVLTDGDNTGWTFCQGWGDPHWTSLYSQKFDTLHVEGFFSDVACMGSDNQAAFTIQTWHMTGCCWGGNTVIRALNVRMGNSMFQWAGSQALSNGIRGPWVYKELVAGVAPASIPWIDFSPTKGSPVTLASGLQIELLSSGGNAYFTVTGAPFGKLELIDYANYATLNMYINLGVCPKDGITSAVCNGGQRPVPSWIFDGGDPSVAPVPLAGGDPIAPPPPQGCSPALQAAGMANCKRSFPDWATTQSFEYSACLSDVCLTGNPWTPPAPCTSGRPCCNCASTGTCVVTDTTTNATRCDCDAGYGGADCSQALNLVTLELYTPTADYDGLPYILSPHDLADAAAKVNNPAPADIAAANPWAVKNSLLAYVATVSAVQNDGSIAHSQHLFLITDATSSTTGTFTHSVDLAYDSWSSTAGTQVAAVGQGTTFGSSPQPTAATFAVQSTAPSGLVYANLPSTWCVSIKTNAGAPNQVVVGSGNIRGQLDVIRVVNTDTGSGLRICGKQIENECAKQLNCADCTARSECGWCRTTGSCRYGRPNGPTDGTLCTAWAFTFADVTRRITQQYGYPVSPVDTTIVLASSAAIEAERLKDLPIEINVDMGARYYAAWDVQILFPSATSNSADVAGFQTAFGDIARRLYNSYANSALSVATYSSRASANAGPEVGSGDSNVFRLLFTLVKPSPQQQDVLQASVNQISLNANALPAQRHLSQAIARAAGSQAPGYRTNSRRLLIIFADAVDIAQQTSDAAALNAAKAALLANSVLPVFIVKSGVRAQYQNYVRNTLGFGLVMDYTSASNIGLLVDRALVDASGAIATLVDSSRAGYVDLAKLQTSNHQDTLMLTGLGAQMRSRNTFPVFAGATVSDKVTQILAPGFGKATIEPVDSDSPYTTGPAVRMVVGQVLDPFTAFPATLVYLSGKPADVLQSTAVTTAWVKAVSKGKLYQFDEQALANGAAISSLEEITFTGDYVQVTDIQSRLIYVPVDDDYDALGQYYAKIDYRVTDECHYSPDGSVYVYVDYSNNKQPETSHTGVTTNENAPLVLEFVGQDFRGHAMNVEITKAPTNDAGRASLSGALYEFSTACWAAVQADFQSPTGCVAVTEGSVLTGTSRSNDPNAAGKIESTVKAIYVPEQYANSDGIPAVYLTKPSMSYKFVQILNSNDAPNTQRETSPISFGIDIRPVNQKPSVALNLGVSRSWLSWPASFIDVEAQSCYSDKASGCNYDQNLGIAYPDLPAALPLYFSGADVDSSSLSAVITGINCAQGAIVNSTASSTVLTVGQSLSFNSNSWAALVKFLPTQDGAASPYCTIKYRVKDEENTSDDEGTIVINIASVPLPPRSEDVRVFAPRLAATPFQFFARSVNDKDTTGAQVARKVVKLEVLSCSGDLTSTLTIDGQTVACGTASPLTMTIADNSADVSTGTGLEHTFNGEWTPTAASAANGLTIKVRFTDDHDPALTSLVYTISFAFRAINYPPEMSFIVPGKDAAYGQNIVNKITFPIKGQVGGGSVGYLARDPDSGVNGQVHAEVNSIGGDESKFDITLTGGDTRVITVNRPGHSFSIDAPINVVNDILASMAVEISQTNKISFNVSITINDNGYTGACSVDNANPCSKVATALLIVSGDSAAPVVAYGLAAGAGGAALAAAAAAAIAWRALRTPPTESYNPWALDDANEGAVSNPLFEERGASGTNPMFEMSGN